MITPEDAISAIKQRFGEHPGFRALHAKGQFCTGTFTATEAATDLTRALPYDGRSLPVTVRFSNGGGDPTVPDYAPDVRGLAVSMHLPDDTRTDIVSQSAPRFPARNADAFIEFVRAMEPGLAQLWRLPRFLLRNRGALGAVVASGPSLVKPPISYASIPYYAVHAFRWTAPDGDTCWVRYRWQPEQEVRLSPLSARKRGPDYLQDELRQRLQTDPIRFALHVQIAGPDDNPDDPTAVWSSDKDVMVGNLEVTGLAPEREAAGEVFVFDPVRVVDGIGLSDDPVLNFRTRAYSVSAAQRAGTRRDT